MTNLAGVRGTAARRVIAVLIAFNLAVGALAATNHASSSQRVGSAAGRVSDATTSSTTTSTGAPSPGDTLPEETVPTAADVSTTTAVTDETTRADGGSEPSTTAPPPGSDPRPGPSCHNSHDPACGDFHWTPTPVNTEVDWHYSVSPAQPNVGDVVTVRVFGSDAESHSGGGVTCWADPCLSRTDGPVGGPVGYGPWSPPTAPSTFDLSVRHTYQQAGTFTVRLTIASFGYSFGEDCPGDPSQPAGNDHTCYDPYREYLQPSFTLTVNP
jgi:hypothetical protein